MESIKPCTPEQTSSQLIYIENSEQALEFTHKNIVLATFFNSHYCHLVFI